MRSRATQLYGPAALVLAACLASPAAAAPPGADARAAEAFARLPLVFEENRGQTDSRVRLLARGEGTVLFLTPAEAVLVLRLSGTPPEPAGSGVIRLRFSGADPRVRLSGEGELPGRTHDLAGPGAESWRKDVRTYARARYTALQPGVDLLLTGTRQRLTWELELAPDTRPPALRLEIEGPDRAEIDPAGDLVLGLRGAEIRLARPQAWRTSTAGRQELASAWNLSRTGPAAWSLAFELPADD
jgi:hypothetical protein